MPHHQPHTIQEILRNYWGYSAFRPLQEDIINAVLAGHDTLALLPTGGGKSICYQVPALALPGLCLVVSPLIALMKDQVEALRRRNITAFAITAAQTRKESEQILVTAGNSNCKFLYVSPERLHTRLFQEYLPGLGIGLLAVDEAHCISQWGYDFRPAYLQIAALREQLSGVPVLAVTASATPEVQQDICKQLLFRNEQVFQGSFLRSNLSFSVFRVDSKITKIRQVLRNVQGSAIVYCRSRRQTQEVARLLQLEGTSADFYHAGLTSEQRSEKQEAWIRNNTRVMVCTNAFGMGIDKPDVRVVLHHDVPDCLENYYQEAGRAGRDGQKSYAVLLYEPGDLLELEQLPDLRYPPLAEVKKVFQCLMNFLQVPAGSGAGTWMEFDITEFILRFQLPFSTTVYALQLLEQEGWINYATQLFLPPRLQFTTNRETLEAFEAARPDLEPVMKSLLRTYGGIFDHDTIISELQLARQLGMNKPDVVQVLVQMHQAGLVQYTPQKEKPQLLLLEDRPASADLFIPPERREQRRQQLVQRVKVMRDYVTGEQTCRSVTIARYFGDRQVENCGLCDVCLFRKKSSLTETEYNSIRQMLTDAAGAAGVPLKQLLDSTGTKRREKIMQVIHHLVAEEKASLTSEGRLFVEPQEPS
ncbi:MAG TPA: ATP-dependent DNA helicase RecQ [Lacibacter sp.]|nr:ATP-dependent DNA helicase RecQ [Lacibacter sp.]HMO87921.1 ATP-dependent DNA helicase RecQ [Lacibacter sp.]